MASKPEDILELQAQLIAGLQHENKLQSKIIEQQKLTIETLEEQSEKFQQLFNDVLASKEKGQ